MKNILTNVENFKLIEQNEKIGVAVSGGIDSMCLLHFLNQNKEKLGIKLLAINIDHSIRQNSKNDSEFVKNYCKEHKIECQSFKVEALDYAKSKKLTIEEAARICRYQVFDNLLKNNVVDKIALAHHKQDQVETLLLNLFRGTGLGGMVGMKFFSNGYIRPILNVDKAEIIAYANEKQIPFVEDETNKDTEYSRNFLRHEVIPLIKSNWNNFENNLLSFSSICKQDDDYINSTIDFGRIYYQEHLVKIPINYFTYPNSVLFRILKNAFGHLKATKDIESKHYNIIANFAKTSQNGTRICLPNSLLVIKEYDYVTISVKNSKKIVKKQKFSLSGSAVLDRDVLIEKVNKVEHKKNVLYFDADKIPKNAVWKIAESGNLFTKFGGGTKRINYYYIDKKIPARVRETLPVLVSDNTILLILGVEISDNIKVDENSKNIYSIKIVE